MPHPSPQAQPEVSSASHNSQPSAGPSAARALGGAGAGGASGGRGFKCGGRGGKKGFGWEGCWLRGASGRRELAQRGRVPGHLGGELAGPPDPLSSCPSQVSGWLLAPVPGAGAGGPSQEGPSLPAAQCGQRFGNIARGLSLLRRLGAPTSCRARRHPPCLSLGSWPSALL